MKKLFVPAVVFVVAIGVLGAIILAPKEQESQDSSEKTDFSTNYEVVETVEDQFLATPTATAEFSPTDEERILAALAAKNNWVVDDYLVAITQQRDQFAMGSVVPDEPDQDEPRGGGGMWFAKEVNGTWEIIWDGNGTIMCSNLEGYEDLPKDWVAECYDSETESMVER